MAKHILSVKFGVGKPSKLATVAEDAVRDKVVCRDVTATIATQRATSGHRNHRSHHNRVLLPRYPLSFCRDQNLRLPPFDS